MKFPQDQSVEACLAAVQQDGFALMYMQQQTFDICLAACRQNPEASEFIKDITLRAQVELIIQRERHTKQIKEYQKDEFDINTLKCNVANNVDHIELFSKVGMLSKYVKSFKNKVWNIIKEIKE